MSSLVAYFSASGTTKKVATKISEYIESDIYEIIPALKYTSSDLNWNNGSSRTSIEGNNPSIRPEIAGDIDISKYDAIYLGFPIWWYRAPNIINTFLEKHEFSNKRIILFATSGGSGFDNTIKGLKKSVSSNTVMIEGLVFKGNDTLNDIKRLIEKGTN